MTDDSAPVVELMGHRTDSVRKNNPLSSVGVDVGRDDGQDVG